MNQFTSLLELIQQYATPRELAWIINYQNALTTAIQRAFVATPRFIAKTPITVEVVVNEVSINGWTLDKLVRVYLLTQLNADDKAAYTKAIDTLFDTAENNEAVALISALPFLSYPDYWMLKATDAVRSNIGILFDAIAFQNTYPQQYFSELAWNQLVLKCIFNDKPIHQIVGLDKRANANLAHSIVELAHERWAAGRQIPSQAWRLVSKFTNHTILKDVQTLFASVWQSDQLAAALLCNEASLVEFKAELQKYPDWQTKIQNQELSWKMLETDQKCY